MYSRIGRWCAKACLIALIAAGLAAPLLAHSGPPFPLFSDRLIGPYRISLWSDPDATDDRTAAGQFWVTIDLADGSTVPPDTRATLTLRALDREAAPETAQTVPVNGEVSRQFVALLMGHEGPFAISTAISGSRGSATTDATVDATYDLRPARWLIGLYLMPFLAIGFLWVKLLLRRRRDWAKASAMGGGGRG